MNEITNTFNVRPNFIDYAKVLMIYIVVLGHYTYALDIAFEKSLVWNLMYLITLFHMPFFFFVAGVLFKLDNVKMTIKKGWIQLIKPYIYISFVIISLMVFIEFLKKTLSFRHLCAIGLGVISANDMIYASKNWASSLWFCYSLFQIKIFMSCIEKLTIRKYVEGLLLLIGILVMHLGNIMPFRIDSSLVGFIFFYTGYKSSQIIKKLNSISLLKRFLIIFLCFLVLTFSAFTNIDYNSPQGGLSINVVRFGKYPLLFLLSGFSGTLIVLIISTFLENCKCNIITMISNGTIIVLGFHWTIYKVLFSWWITKMQYYKNVFISMLVSFIVFLICDLLIPFFGKCLPGFMGNRQLK